MAWENHLSLSEMPVYTIAQMSLSAGQKLGPYEIVGSLGAGGMGEVYRARDTRLERSVAIKILPAAREVASRYESFLLHAVRPGVQSTSSSDACVGSS
jgi:serine/threonine protein kinase